MAVYKKKWVKGFNPLHTGRKCKYVTGFTFIEILLTLLIFSICFLPLMRMFTIAMQEIAYIDDMRVALDLAREEVEKVRNLALTEDQIKQMKNVASPPMYLNNKIWRTLRVVDQNISPLQFSVYVYRGDSLKEPLLFVATVVNKS